MSSYIFLFHLPVFRRERYFRQLHNIDYNYNDPTNDNCNIFYNHIK